MRHLMNTLTRLAPLLPVGVLILAPGLIPAAFAHEPVFSLGPETIWDQGLGVEWEFEFEDEGDERTSALHYELLYGVTTDLSLSLEVPHVLAREDLGETSQGLGDIELRTKYQFFRQDLLGAQHKITGIAGVKFPTGDEDETPALGSGAPDYLLGVSYGYESRTWYQFLTARYRLGGESGDREPGDRVLLDGAIGYRPLQREYTEWDLVVLLEANAEFSAKDRISRATLADTGGERVWLGPSALFSPNPRWMIKGGVQIPVYQHLNGNQEEAEVRAVFAVETHF